MNEGKTKLNGVRPDPVTPKLPITPRSQSSKEDKIEITEELLNKLFTVYNVMEVIEEWENYDNELKAHYLFNILKEIKNKHENETKK